VRKRARFAGYEDDAVQEFSRKFVKHVGLGRICDLLSLKLDCRLCFAIKDQKLWESDDLMPLERLLEEAPSISLSAVLERYSLTPKMKVALAYILARSVWQFYDSDWMKTKWTSETIEFIRECKPSNDCEPECLYAWKPYFSIKFSEDDSEFPEYSDADGKIHRYPRVLALGIILVEIGLGVQLRNSGGS
jgi:hypothetical protein